MTWRWQNRVFIKDLMVKKPRFYKWPDGDQPRYSKWPVGDKTKFFLHDLSVTKPRFSKWPDGDQTAVFLNDLSVTNAGR